jgi:hypothetical protein
MRNYLGVASITIFILTFLSMQIFVIGKVSGATGSAILMFGVGLSIVFALFSQKGRMKTIVLSLYGVLIVGFVTISILFGVAHM